LTFAATTQQAIAIVVFLIVIAGSIAFFFANNRKAKAEVGSEIELAPNRKAYLDDEQLEGPRLEKVLLWGVLSLMVIGVGLPLYWVTEPNRQAGAIDYFADRLSGKTYHHGQPVGGGALFAVTAEGGFNCAGCHGGDAATGGQVVPYTLTDPVSGDLRQVQWKVPSLNTAVERFSDESLKDILIYGRPFSPMPAWGVEGGGPMNEQQIDNLVKYLHRINDELDRGAAREESAAAAEAELERLKTLEDQLTEAEAALAALGSDATDEERADAEDAVAKLESEIALGQPATMGAALFNMNCARCHTQGWSYDDPQEPGGGGFGPPLYNTTDQFPNEEDHIEWVANGRQDGERYGEVGQASGRMPYFVNILTAEQIEAIVEYERSLEQGS
jgi:mono/diheme cytochrome c family protein